MDLGIAGRSAIVCGGSAGLGKGIALALAQEGVKVLIVARDRDRLQKAASEISTEAGHDVDTMAVGLADHESREGLFDRCKSTDILINNAGGPPVGDFRTLSRDDWIKALDTNMLGAIDLINASIDGMAERKFGRILNITSHMVKAPVALLNLVLTRHSCVALTAALLRTRISCSMGGNIRACFNP